MKLNIRSRKRSWLVAGVISVILVLVISSLGFNRYTRHDFFGLTISGGVAYALLLAAASAAVLTYMLREFHITRLLKQRQKKLTKFSHQLGMRRANIPLSEMLLAISDNKQKFHKRRLENGYIGDGWGYGEYKFTRYGRTKHGKYDQADYHYAVAVFRLPRKLPNVLFDSKKSGGREFKALLDDDQRHSLESVFDNHFDTYFHNDYRVDSLSFITPEVMWALIDAEQCDIEIYGDHLYLYNELENMPKQLIDMQSAGFRIVSKLANNIYSYRDERIPFKEGRRTVSVLGLHLRKSLTFDYFVVAATTVFLIGATIAGLWQPEIAKLLLYVGIIAVTALTPRLNRILKIRSERRFAEYNRNVGVK